MEKNQENANFWSAVFAVLFAGIIIKIVSDLLSESKTEVISDKGLQAINDPEKKKKIDDAFAESAKKQRETGIWENPVVDLN